MNWPANSGSLNIMFPTFTTADTSAVFFPYVPLQPVAAAQSEWAVDRDAKLTPLEWLERQIDDVCRLARTT